MINRKCSCENDVSCKKLAFFKIQFFKKVALAKKKTEVAILNPFVTNAPFLYHLKTSENRKGVEKGCIGNKWVKM